MIGVIDFESGAIIIEPVSLFYLFLHVKVRVTFVPLPLCTHYHKCSDVISVDRRSNHELAFLLRKQIEDC